MSNIKKQARFQKSTISIVIISAITVGLITLEQSVNKNDLFSAQQNSLFQDSTPKKMMTNTEFSKIGLVEEIAPITESLELAQVDVQEIQIEPPVELVDVQAIQIEPPVKLVNKQAMQIDQQVELVSNSIIDTAIEGNVLFDFSSSEIGSEYYQLLLETAQLIKTSDTDNQSLWQVVGYADLTGNHQFNIDLAKQRAQTVAEFLVDNGVDETQLSIVSLGDTNPIEADQKRGANQLDRRVEIHSYQAEITALADQLNIKNKQTAKVLTIREEQISAITEEQVLAVTEEQVIAKEKKSVTKSSTQEKLAPTDLTKQQPATSNLLTPSVKSNLLTSSTKIDF